MAVSTAERLLAYQGLQAIHKAFEGAALELEQARAAPLCLEHCGKCCEVNTPYIWDIEARFILSCAIGDGSAAKTIDRCEAWMLDRHRGLALYGPRVDAQSEQGRAKILAETAVAAATCCPFLDSDKRCAIHAVRPVVCRAYNVTRLPSQFDCPAPLGFNETRERRARYDDIQLKLGVRQFLQSLSAEHRASYFLPTAIFRLARPNKFFDYEDRFATAKMVAMPHSPAVIWQDQLEQQWTAMGVR